ncbi:MAG: N4-gp56 family major capsid protein [Alphaproteobacteria bacterium]
MTVQTFALTPGRLNKFKGQILAHAVPLEVLGKTGRQVKLPRNNSDTYVARRWLPYGATSTDANTINRFFQNGTGDRGNAVVQANQISEGVTPSPESITPQDITVVVQQYGCLYGFTDKTYDLYEDDIPAAMIEQIGERVTFVNEMIVWGALRACTNQYYGGTGTSRATVNGALTLGMVRKIARNLQANHGKPVNSVLSASGNYGTDAVAEGYTVYCHTDMEPDIRDLPGFVPAEKYASGKPMPNEIGKCERFRFITSPDLPSIQDAGAAVGSTGLQSTTGTNIDVYQFIVTAKDAWSQIAVRGKESLDPTYLPPGQKTKSDPLGQRGYAGTIWWKAVMLENQGWLAVGNVGIRTLS